MIEWLTVLFDSRVFMKANAILGFVLLGFFIFFYFSKEGRDERGRGLIATASLAAFVVLFVLLNAAAYFFSWAMDNIVRLANLIQTVYTLFLLSADIALLVLRKIR
ncbi:MAG: hypothetical protein HFF75_03860 [Oscillospiraceae bacterium]|nr:hypothetical protein [Oscillospiraceae bacterium]